MEVAGGGVEVVAALRLVAVAKAAWIEHIYLAACLDEERGELAPCDPTLGPTLKNTERIRAS